MAKCILYPNGVIARMSDDNALAVVLAGAAMYTSKSRWKAYIKDDIVSYRFKVARENKIKNNIIPIKNAKKEARHLARLERFRKEHGLRRAA